jgi:lysophospholipase
LYYAGGSFLIGSLFTTDFETIDYLHDHVWRLDIDMMTPAGNTGIENIGVYSEFLRDMAQKKKAGFPTTITDYWARLVSVHTTNSRNWGVDVTMSGLANYKNFKSYKTPFPVVVWNERFPGQLDLTGWSNVVRICLLNRKG